MKLLSFASIFILIYRVSGQLVLPAINGILQEYFASNSPKIDVVWASDDTSKLSEELVDGILSEKNDLFTFKVSKFDKMFELRLNKSSIVIFDCGESFQRMAYKILIQTDPTIPYKHLFYFPNAQISDLQYVRTQFSIENVNFLMNESEKSIEIVTGYIFSPQECRVNQFVSINQFEKSSMEWETSNFYPDKYRNLHWCELTYNSKSQQSWRRKVLWIYANLVRANLVDKASERVYTDLPWTAEFFSTQNQKLNNTLIGYTYNIGKWVIYIPPGDLYTNLEKMLAPFQLEVWIGIAVTLSIILVAIQVVKCFGSKVKKFVFGSTIQTPTLNMLNIFLNGSQVQSPGRNFSRFIFLLFVFWCLVIRTCHQSELFKHLQADRRKPEFTTIDELIENNFAFQDTGEKYDNMRQLEKELFEGANRKVTERFENS
jgi:hypothetical protein